MPDITVSTIVHQLLTRSTRSAILDILLPRTITPIDQTGAKTINTPLGTVNFAPSTDQIVVTCSLATENSLIWPFALDQDATAVVDSVSRFDGSFVINLSAPTTSVLPVGFLIL